MEIRDLKEVQQIIHRGKAKGFLTLDEVNRLLPADTTSPDQLDDVVALLGEVELEFVDDATPPVDDADRELDEDPLMVAESEEVV